MDSMPSVRLPDHDTHLVALLLCLSGLVSPLGCVGLDFVKSFQAVRSLQA
jgi:hypothetical protein